MWSLLVTVPVHLISPVNYITPVSSYRFLHLVFVHPSHFLRGAWCWGRARRGRKGRSLDRSMRSSTFDQTVSHIPHYAGLQILLNIHRVRQRRGLATERLHLAQPGFLFFLLPELFCSSFPPLFGPLSLRLLPGLFLPLLLPPSAPLLLLLSLPCCLCSKLSVKDHTFALFNF